MKRLATFLLTALWFFCQTSKCQDYSSCGVRSLNTRGRIIGGIHSRPGMWPWQVAIFRGQNKEFHCGGALINSKWVVTAAHCFHSATNEQFKYIVIAGDYNITSKEPNDQERNAFKIYIHPHYISRTYENDIALVELDKSVKMGSHVRAICLPKAGENLSIPGKIGNVAGWGWTGPSRKPSTVLLHSAYQIQSNKKCDDATNYPFNGSVMFCGGDGKGGNDTCKGDSGGSLVRNVLRDGRRRWVTVGLVSWGEGCARKDKYGYYTRMEPFVNWIQRKTVSALSCGNPGNIPNGKIIGSDFLVGFNVKYTCNNGYQLRGRSKMRCQRNGQWTRAPMCRKVECRNPGDPRYGVRRPRQSKYYYKDKIRFRCKTNYTIVGRSVMVCQSNRKWNRYKPVCLAPCKDPGVPEGGVRLDHNFKHGATVRFICTMKNQKQEHYVRVCSNGRWDQNIPTCKRRCSSPGRPVKGNIYPNTKKSLYSHKDRVRFYCYRGYKLVGDEYITCLNGDWNSNPPKCKRLCGNPGRLANGRFKGSVFFEGGELRFFCRKGSDLIGSHTTRCLPTGRWSGRRPECKRRCNNPRMPSNGPASNPPLTRGQRTKHGKTIRFSCRRPRYTLEGQHTIRCKNGRWSHTIPVCKDYSLCGESAYDPRGRMVGGIRANRGRWPWQLGLHKNLKILCGGALIERGWVLTAAHCFHWSRKTDLNPNSYAIKAGDHLLEKNERYEQKVQAEEIFIHPDYNPQHFDNDIALVKLQRKFDLGPFVRTVCLPKMNEELLQPGNHGTVAGWGTTQKLFPGERPDPSHQRSKVLLQSAFTIQDNERCNASTTYHFNPTVMFCAGDGKGGNGTCSGDSGGSFVRHVPRDGAHKWVSVGLPSWGEGCGLAKKYGFYTRVAPFVDWIKKIMRDNE